MASLVHTFKRVLLFCPMGNHRFKLNLVVNPAPLRPKALLNRDDIDQTSRKTRCRHNLYR